MFAGAPSHRFGRGDFHLLRSEAGPFVRPVAKRLALRPAAGAPPILAWFDLLNDGRFLGNNWFTHEVFLTAAPTAANIFFKFDGRARENRDLRPAKPTAARGPAWGAFTRLPTQITVKPVGKPLDVHWHRQPAVMSTGVDDYLDRASGLAPFGKRRKEFG